MLIARRSIPVLTLGLLLMAGCGSSPDTQVGSGGVSSGPELPRTVVVSLRLGEKFPNASLRIENESGLVVARGETGGGNFVVFENVLVGPNFHAFATLPGVGQDFEFEAHGFAFGDQEARISPVTTLVSRFHRIHPEVSVDQAEAVIKRTLGINSIVDVNLGPVDPNPYFSPLAFWQAASANGGWNLFSSKLLSEAEQLQNQPRSSGPRFLLRRSDLESPITGLEPPLNGAIEKLRLLLKIRQPVIVLEGEFGLKPFAFGLSQGVLGNVLTGGTNLVGHVLFTWLVDGFGSNSGTSKVLQDIQQTLNSIAAEVDQLATDLAKESLANDVINLYKEFDKVIDASAQTSSQAGATLAAISSGTLVLNTIPSQPVDIRTLISAVKAPSYQDILRDADTALTQILDQARTIELTNKRGIDENPAMLGRPWRAQANLDSEMRYYNLFYQLQLETINLLAEQGHSYIISPDPVVGTKGILQVFLGGLSHLKRQRQRYPLLGDNPQLLVDLEYGIMWDAEFQTSVQSGSGATTWNAAKAYADAHAEQIFFADGSTTIYRDWHLPTSGEVGCLEARGQHSPTADLDVPHKSDNVGDKGRTTPGLPSLGFENVAAAFKADSSGSNGSIWIHYIKEIIPQFGAFSYELESNYEYRLNEAKLEQKDHSSDTNAFVLCRNLSTDVLPSPYANVKDNYNGDPASLPGITLHNLLPAEIALWGTPTQITLKKGPPPPTVSVQDDTFVSPLNSFQLAAYIEYSMTIGGSFTVGQGSKTASFRLPSPAPYTTILRTVDESQAQTPSNLSNFLDWSAGAGYVTANVFNDSTLGGIVVPQGSSQVTLTATLLGKGNNPVTGSLTLTPTIASAPTLKQVLISPRNQIYGRGVLSSDQSQGLPLSLTGFYSDGSLRSLSSDSATTWTVTPQNGDNAQIVGGALTFKAQPVTTVVPYISTITASYKDPVTGTVKTDSTTLEIYPPLK